LAKKNTGSKRIKNKDRKSVPYGIAHVQSTFNNTIVNITDPNGNTILWGSGGGPGCKGPRLSTPFAAQITANAVARNAQEHGLMKVDVRVKGVGSGRETAVRSLQAAGLEIGTIIDVTPVPHNGCRQRRRRRP